MEISVLSHVQLGSIDAWQEAVDEQGFGLRLDTRIALDAVRGFLPAMLGTKSTGFECFNDDVRELVAAYREIGLRDEWTHALSLRWGGTFDEGVAAWMAATAYAAATRGVILDSQEGKVYDAEEALQVTRDYERSRPLFEARLQRLQQR